MSELKPPPGGRVEIIQGCRLLKCGWNEAIDLVAKDTPGPESSLARRKNREHPRDPFVSFDLVLARGGSIGSTLVDLPHLKTWGVLNSLIEALPIEILSGMRKPGDWARLGKPLVSVVCSRNIKMASLDVRVFCLSRNFQGTQAQYIKNVFFGKSSINWAAFVVPSK